jgi:hypothetical protein
MITETELDEIRNATANTMPATAYCKTVQELFDRLVSEHAAMREALRWRKQSDEPAPDAGCDYLYLQVDGVTGTARPGLLESTDHWLPIPPLNKE